MVRSILRKDPCWGQWGEMATERVVQRLGNLREGLRVGRGIHGLEVRQVVTCIG